MYFLSRIETCGILMGGSGGATTCSKKRGGFNKRKASKLLKARRSKYSSYKGRNDRKRLKSLKKDLHCNKTCIDEDAKLFNLDTECIELKLSKQVFQMETKHRRSVCIDDVVDLFSKMQCLEHKEPHNDVEEVDIESKFEETDVFCNRFIDFIRSLRNLNINKDYMKVFENMIYLCLILYKTDDSAVITSSILLFIGSISDSSPVELITDFVHSMFLAKEPHAFCSLDFIRGFKLFKNSQMLAKLNSLLSLVISLGLLEPIHFTMGGFELFRNEGMKVLTNANDFFDYIVDLVEYFITEGQRFFETGIFDFRSQNELSQIDDTIIHLKSNIERIVNGDYEMATGKTVCQYQNDLMTTLESCRYLANNTKDKNYRALMYGKIDALTKITIIFEQCRPMAGMRQAPYAYSVYGLSSVGKSSFVNILTLSILKHNGFSCKDSNICTLQSNDKFYSTYKADTTAVLLDDLANNKDQVSSISPADMIISLVNNIPYYAPKAESSEKGKIIVQPKVVAVTTNVKDLSSNYWSNEPISVLRRLDLHITLKVRPEFATNGKLDSSKLTTEVLEEYAKYGTMDVWLVTLETIVPKPFQVIGSSEPYDFRIARLLDGREARDIDIYTTIKELLVRSTSHYKRQGTLVKSSSNMAVKLSFCKKCLNCTHKCVCKVIPTTCTPVVEDVDSDLESLGEFSEPHSFIFEKAMDYVAKTAANGLYTSLTRAWEYFTPTPFEAVLLDKGINLSLPYVIDAFANKYLNLFSYLPLSSREDKFYQKLYTWIHRKHFVRSLHITWVFNSVVATAWLYRTRCRDRNVNIICALMPITSTIICNRITYHQLCWRLRTLPYVEPDKKHIAYRVGSGLLKAGVSVATGILVCKTVRSFLRLFTVPQGNLNPQTEKAILERDTEVNVWSKVSEPFRYCQETSTFTSKQLCNKLSSNCLHMFFEDDYVKTNVSCLVLKSNVFMCPYHFFFKNGDIYGSMYDGSYIDGTFIKGVFRVSFLRSAKSEVRFTSDIYLSSIIRIATHDLCVFQIHSGGTFNDITPYLGSGPYKGPILGVFREPSGAVIDVVGYTTPCETSYKVRKLCSITKPVKILGGNVTYNINTVRGMCTACLVTDTKNPTLYGFHIAGFTGHSNGSYIHASRDEVNKAIDSLMDQLGTLECHSAGVFDTVRYGERLVVSDDLDIRSPVNYIEEESYKIHGSIGTGSTYYSEIQNTFISKDIEELMDYPNKWGKPQFGPQRWKPWYAYLKVAAPPSRNFDPVALKRAKNDYLKPLLRHMETYNKMVYPLSDSEVINGRPGVRFIDAINFQSGIGYPLSGKKKDHLEGNIGEFRFKNEADIYGTYDSMIMKYLNDERYYPVFKSCLKDEATSLGKDKVRVFQAAEISLQLGWRKYGLPVLRFLSCVPLVSECAVGINPFSDEWDQLHKYVTFDGNSDDLIVAGDYSKWDIRLPPDLVSMAFQIIIELAEASGNYQLNELKIMRGLATDTVYFVTHFNGTLVELMSGVPSGHNLTAHINSICNSLLLRMCFFEHNTGSFRAVCHFTTYGDDFMGGNANKYVKFNHIIYKAYLARYEIILTMPNKVDEPTEFLNIFSCDFLKRRSVYCARTHKYYGALTVDSLFKSLHNRGKLKISARHHIISVMESFIHEMSYNTKENYDFYMHGLRLVCEKHLIVLPQLYFSYNEIHDFRTRSTNGLSATLDNKPPVSEDGHPLTLEASDDIDYNETADFYMSDESASTGDECEPNSSLPPLTNNKIISEDELISSVRVALKPTRLPEPHSEIFGNGPGWNGEQVTQTGTTTLTAVHEEHFHEMTPISQDMLSLRQDETRSLGKFLSRPVRIATYSVSPEVEEFHSPLSEMLLNPHVRDKIKGYAYLNARIHVRINVTSSPQTSGAVHIALHPWWQRDNGLGASGNTTDLRPTLSTSQMSQLPNIIVDFGNESGGELNMPIIAPCNGLNMWYLNNMTECFGLHIRSLFPVQLATGQTTPPQFHVLVWLTEVSLTGTTLRGEFNEPQSDEYCKKPEQVPSSDMVSFKDTMKMAAREIAGKATDIGVDTMMGAIGLSNPLDPSGSSPMIPRSSQNMASTNAYCNTDTLAADVKNQITLDLSTLGYKESDPMALYNMYSRWAIIGLFTMPSGGASVAGLPIRAMPVNPTACQSTVIGAQLNYYPTPLNMVALSFRKWRGTMKYRFKVIGTAFVKGKIRISHDVNELGALSPTYTDTLDASRLNTVIWDLGTTRSIIIEVPWTSNLPFKSVELLSDSIIAPTGIAYTFPTNIGSNGNLLVSPYTQISDGTQTTVGIIVEACGKEGFAFGDLRPMIGNYTFAGINNGTSGVPEPQSFVYDKNLDSNILSGEQPNSTITVNIAGFVDEPADSDLMCDACLGERFHSLHQIIKRYTLNWTRQSPFDIDTVSTYNISNPDRPILQGWQGSFSISVDPGKKPVTYARDSFLSFYGVCFMGMRGSLRHKVEILDLRSQSGDKFGVYVTRSEPVFSVFFAPINNITDFGSASSVYSCPDARSGMLLANTSVNNILEYSTPFQCRSKFVWAQDRTPHIVKNTDDGGYDYSGHTIGIYHKGGVPQQIRINKYIAAGDDFTFMFFLYAPTMVTDRPLPYSQE